MVVLIFVLSIPCLIVYLAGRPAIPYHKLDQLKLGMSRAEVQTILGPSDSILPDKTLIYRRFANPGWMEVYFDQHDKLDHVNDESAYIWRTFPHLKPAPTK